uniref:UBX domain-containing protein 4 n=1 Tax=Chrysemys picta bellii TaxID=8478 RepID=A0A8C3P3K7_CHRPI
MKASRKELEEQQREHLAQEAKAEKQNKQKERELVLQRIADDRRSVQAKIQWAQITDPPAAQGHRPEGRAQLASDGQCLLMIRLPSGQCLRERFPADCPLQHVTQRLSTLHPDLPPFTLLQGFPKRRFGPAELPCSLQALGLTPSATLCVLATEPLPSGTCALAAPQARDEPLQPPGPQALPMEEHAWGRGEILSLVPEQAMAEGMFPEAEELRLALSSPARRVVPGKPGVHVLWESTSPSHHRWGQGQRLTLENPEQAPTAPTVCSPLAEELSPPGSGPAPLLPSPSRGPVEPQHQWPAEGNRLRAADDGRGVGPSDLPGAVAQAAEQRFHNALRGQEEPAPLPGHKNPPRLSHVPPLFHTALRAAVALLTAPRKQYCSSLASLTPPLAERLLADMILHRRLRPKTLELFFGCHIQTLVLSCYPYATNELLRQLRAFQSLRHLSLVSCSLLTDQGLSVVRHLQRLQHLNLSACVKLTDACLHFIKGLPHLSHLTLDQTKISDCGMADYLHSAPSALSHLSLNRTAITERTLRLLPQCAPGLVLLGLKQTEISDFSALQQLSHLHTLHLDDTRVSQASLAALASHPALSTLTLSGVQSVDGDRALQLVSGRSALGWGSLAEFGRSPEKPGQGPGPHGEAVTSCPCMAGAGSCPHGAAATQGVSTAPRALRVLCGWCPPAGAGLWVRGWAGPARPPQIPERWVGPAGAPELCCRRGGAGVRATHCPAGCFRPATGPAEPAEPAHSHRLRPALPVPPGGAAGAGPDRFHPHH